MRLQKPFFKGIHKPRLMALDFLKYIGPGFLVTIGFIDPGNWAANISAGSRFGYSLLWVVTLSTLFLIVLQHNAAHLGIVTGLCLSESATVHIKPWISKLVLSSAMVAAVSTALAEILGAVVMPHNLFLHSEIIQSRQWNLQDEAVRIKQMKYEFADTIFSMVVGWAINCAIILIAATTFFANNIEVSELAQAEQMMRPLLGSAAAVIFAIAFLFSGISAPRSCCRSSCRSPFSCKSISPHRKKSWAGSRIRPPTKSCSG